MKRISRHSGQRTRREWAQLLKTKCDLGRSRAYELIAIAEKRKTVAEVRLVTAERVRKHAAANKTARHNSSVTNGQNKAASHNSSVTDGPNKADEQKPNENNAPPLANGKNKADEPSASTASMTVRS